MSKLFWNKETAKAFRDAEANFQLSGLDPLTIEHYKATKARIVAGEINLDEAVRLAVEHHTKINRSSVPLPAASDEDDPYCYPGTDVLINKLGLRNQQALEIAETEIGTLRDAQLILFGLPA
jgi:hypothetical protein